MYVDILILAHLSGRPQHGYELKRSVQQQLGKGHTLNNGILYPALRRLEEMGAVEREVERQQGRPDRHIYQLTPVGHDVLHDLLIEFPPEAAHSDIEFLVRVAFFEELKPEERLAILAARRAELVYSVDGFERIRGAIAEEGYDIPHYGHEVMRFREEQRRHELAWVDELIAETKWEEGER